MSPEDEMPRRIRALIVDDSLTSRMMITRSLSQTGLADFEFIEAGDGIDGLDKYREGETDLVFADMHMPRMGGIEFIQKLRSLHSSCPPCIMITAEKSQERMLAAVNQARVDAFLLKPLDQRRLREGLQKLVDSVPDRAGSETIPHEECAVGALTDILQRACDLELRRTDRVGGVMADPVATADVTDEGAPRPENAVFALISFMGAVHWSVVIGFEQRAAEVAASKFAGIELDFEDPDFGDAIGEVANMIGGQAKRLMLEQGLVADFSLPTVVSARDIRFLVQRGARTNAGQIRFDSAAGRVWMGITAGLNAGLLI